MRRKTGRPHYLFSLSESGEDLFPPLSVLSVWHYLGRPKLVVRAGPYGAEGVEIGERFVPTDEAFAAYLGQNDMSQEEAFAGAEMLQSILGYHVVTMTEDSEMVMGMDGQTFTTLNGAPLEVSVDGDTVMVGAATILRYDIVASNGVVHVIDTVLTPPAG